MGVYNVVGAASMAAGQPEDVTQVLANFNAIATILNGGIDNSNVNAAAAILLSKLAGYPADGTKFAAGDGTWKLPPGGGITKIGEVILAVNNASISFAAIPATYSNLMLIGSLRSVVAATNDDALLRINGDSAANYEYSTNYFSTAAAAVSQAASMSDTGLHAPTTMPGNASTAGIFGSFVMEIPGYADLTTGVPLRNVQWRSSSRTTGAVAGSFNAFGGGDWVNTAAINALAFTTTSGSNWKAGSRITLYGLS